MRRAAALAARRWPLAGCGAAAASRGGRARRGSTLRATLVDRDGDGFLEPGPGEPLRDRGRPAARPARALATFGQLTDTHVRDEESPARAPFLDRLGAPFNSTFRPQEAFSAQVLDAAVRALDARAPAGRVRHRRHHRQRRSRTSSTLGASTCSTAARVHPDSGAPGYDGVQDADSPDPFYYRPDHDAPRHPGVLAAAQRPVPRRRACDAPWYPTPGNHDLLVQGEVPPTPAIEAVATGDRLVTTLDPALTRRRAPRPTPARRWPTRWPAALPADAQRVPADPARRHVSPAECDGPAARPPPAGRGGRAAGGWTTRSTSGRRVRAIVLDTVRRAGGSRGAAQRRAQLALAARAARGGRRPLGRGLLAQPARRDRRRRRGARRARRRPARRRRGGRQPPPQHDHAGTGTSG